VGGSEQLTWLRRGAFAAGLVAAATLAFLGRVPAGAEPLALDATVTTGPTGELAVTPAGPVAVATGLAPGAGRLSGRVTLTNLTDARLAVRVRMRASISDADSALRVRVGDLYSGPVGGLRGFSGRALPIEPHATETLDVEAWLPEAAPDGWEGRSLTMPLEYGTAIDGKERR
jgi:hypothetical protein